jgi:3D (Asp-Asp-Asp) domain-containing protein
MKLFSIKGVVLALQILAITGVSFLSRPIPVNASVLLSSGWFKVKFEQIVPVLEAKADEPVVENTDMPVVLGNALLASSSPETVPSKLTSTEGRILPRPKGFRVQPGTTFDLTVTAYSSTVDQCDSDPFTTASGTRVHDGTVAANFLPFGTHVTFPDYSGNKVYTIEDRTNAKYSSRADMWMVSRSAALQFGKRHLQMVVVE